MQCVVVVPVKLRVLLNTATSEVLKTHKFYGLIFV